MRDCTTKTLIHVLAATLDAYHNCLSNGSDYATTHVATLLQLKRDFFPSGSGIDNGTHLNTEDKPNDVLKMSCGFHHLNEGGFYDGWTEHTITVKPHLYLGITLTISGRNRNDVKEYLSEVFRQAMLQPIVYNVATSRYVRSPE